MNVQLDVGAWRVGLANDVMTYVVSPHIDALERFLVANVNNFVEPAGIVVEIVHRISGMRPHALLAAAFEPTRGDRLLLEVVRGAPFDLSGPSGTSPLSLPITVGLPPELAEAAAEGFMASSDAAVLPAGSVKIIGGAIDHDSSPMVFLRCGAVLREAVLASASSRDPRLAIEELIAAW